MFVDTAKVFIQAGKGGDGAVSFRHEIYVDKGGPDGGNGGKGGDVIFEASENVNTLLDFRYKPELKAKPGENGAKANRAGKSGADFIVKVPLGTLVKKDGEVIADLIENGQQVIVAHGGGSGFGNAHFKSSVRQTPRIAEVGELGETFEAQLELKLLADVGLVGFPNAGKSTFLSVVSNARPEIADYAFTTLTPNLGVADIDDSSLLIADIPGLIEGASLGKGLGDAFLRHIERTSVLLHLIDVYSNDIDKAYQTIRLELASYNSILLNLPEVVVLTKVEGVDDDIIQMQMDAVREVAGKDTPIFAISAQAHTNITEVLRTLLAKVKQVREARSEVIEEDDPDMPVIRLSEAQVAASWTVRKDGDEYIVAGDKIEKFARRTDYSNYEGLNRLRDIMKKMSITYELKRQGADGTSIIHIDKYSFPLLEQ